VEHAKCESRFQEEWVLPSWSATPIYSIWVPIQTSSRSGWTGTTVCKFCFFEKTNLGRNAGNANLEAKPEQRWIESCIQASEASRFSESHTGDLAKREKFEPVKSCFPLSFFHVFFENVPVKSLLILSDQDCSVIGVKNTIFLKHKTPPTHPGSGRDLENREKNTIFAWNSVFFVENND